MAIHVITLLIASVIVSSCLGYTMKLHYPSIKEEGVFPRVKVETTFKSLTSFTLCLWAKSNENGAASFSYGVPGQDKEISLSLEKTIEFYVGGNQLLGGHCDGRYSVAWVSGEWRHICVTWARRRSAIRSYVNGKYCSRTVASEESISAHTVPGNGVMILGQALNGLDTDFLKNESWVGDIAGVEMWDEILSYEQIVNLGRCKGNLEGNVVSWMKTPMVAFDGVILDRADVCSVIGKSGD